jgi:hypothetical protein
MTLGVLICLAFTGLVGAQASGAKVRTCPDLSNNVYPEKKHGGYITNFFVTNVTCSSAKKLALAYTRCRLKKGIKGSCSGQTVNGLKCKEFRPESGDNGSEFNATVTCKKSPKKVVFSYQQFY